MSRQPNGASSWRGRRVFVTGASGVVGSWLTKGLVEEGADVAALLPDNDPRSELYRSGVVEHVRVFTGRLESFATVERAVSEHEADTVFHLGAQALVTVAYRSPLATFETNIRGTYNVLEACRRHGDLVQRVVVASSDKAYGDQDRLPYVEDMPLRGSFPYDVSKSCTDLLARSYHASYEVPVAIARCGNIFGGGDLNWSRIVPGTIRSLFLGQRPVIRSDGTCVRDYIYVKDVVTAFLALADRLGDEEVRGEAFNFGPERPLSVVEAVEAIRRQMGRMDLEPEILDVARGEIRDQYLSSAKARRLLDWTLAYSLEAGLEETIDWYDGFLARA